MDSTCQVESICVITLQIIIIISQKSHDNIIIVINHTAISLIQLKIRANKVAYININLVEIVNNVTEILNQPLRMVNQPHRIVNQPLRMVNQSLRMVNKPLRMINQPPRMVNQPLRIVNKLP